MLKKPLEKRYGRLTVLSIDTFNRRLVVNCSCDCGNNKKVGKSALLSGATSSCGCLHKERARASAKLRRLPNNESAFNDIIYKYKLRSKKENIYWELSKEDCRRLFKDDCFYCGIEPSRKKIICSSEYIYNGIDRVNNNIGYTLENSVSCCMRCNYMKSDMNLDDFYNHIKLICEKIK